MNVKQILLWVIAPLFLLVGGVLLYIIDLPPIHHSIKTYTVGIIQNTDHPALIQTRKGIIDVLTQKGYIHYTNTLIKEESADGNVNKAEQIIQNFIKDNVDIIIAIGTPVAQIAARHTTKTNIPVVFASVTDPIAANLVESLEAPGGHVTGVTNYVSISRQFSYFKRLMPALKEIGVIYNPNESNSVAMIDKMRDVSDMFGIKIYTEKATDAQSIEKAVLNLIQKGADAFFVNNDNNALQHLESITKIATKHNIPVFVSDIDCLNKGALAVLGPDQYEIGKQAAEMATRILSGNKPQYIPVESPNKVSKTVNTTVAEQFQIIYKQSSYEKFQF